MALSCLSLATLHSNCSSTKLCTVSAKEWKEVIVERRGQHGSLYVTCGQESYCFNMMGFLPHFRFVLLIFCFLISLPLSLHLLSTLFCCACMSLHRFLSSHSFPLIFLPMLKKVLAFSTTSSVSLNFLICFFPFPFSCCSF